MKLQDAINDYLLCVRHERGLSKTTCKHYASWLHNLHRWMTENGYPEPQVSDFTTPLLRRFLYHLAGKNYRPRTTHSAFHPIRGLSVFLVDNGALKENPANGVSLPKKDAAIRLTVSEEEIARLMEACERQRCPKQVAFARAVLSVLVYAGLRRQEMLDLKLGDVNFSEGSLLVRSGKGGKSRKVFLCDDALNALREWSALRPADCKHDYLFSLDRNRRLHHMGLQTLMEDIKAIAGLAGAENIKPHSLRHACATRLLRNGADLRSIQAFLGHSSLQVTSIYLHTDEQQLRNIAHLSSLQTTRQPIPKDMNGRFRRVPVDR